MARPREFDMEETLEGAMNVFWEHGYDAASLPQLLEGMSMTRGSLYKAFTDKKNLFLMALKRYGEAAVDQAFGLLSSPDIPNGLERISLLFNSVVEVVQSGDRRGCLLCSAAAGPAAVDEDIAKSVHQLMSKMLKGFEIALADSPHHASLEKKERNDLANLLLTHYVGLRVLARSNASTGTLRKSVRALGVVLET